MKLKTCIKTITILWICIAIQCSSCKLLDTFKTSLHDKKCYTQGLFFMNSTHLFQSCGLYNKSFYHVLKYSQNQDNFWVQQVYRSSYPIENDLFLEGATYFPKTQKIYVLTWQQHKVLQVNPVTFQIEKMLIWQKNGWGITNNQTHLFITDGSPKIFLVDENMKILQEKIIYTKNGKKLHNINELQLVKDPNGSQYIYANVYMERRIVKINYETGRVIEEIDGLKIIQNQKGIKYDEVINGIALIPGTQKFLITGKNWGNFYKVDL